MKVRIENVKSDDRFVPYSVCFKIESPDESARFHDKVAIKIAKPGEFVRQIYVRGCELDGKYEDSEFDI